VRDREARTHDHLGVALLEIEALRDDGACEASALHRDRVGQTDAIGSSAELVHDRGREGQCGVEYRGHARQGWAVAGRRHAAR
jgi:hypothetical protein